MSNKLSAPDSFAFFKKLLLHHISQSPHSHPPTHSTPSHLLLHQSDLISHTKLTEPISNLSQTKITHPQATKSTHTQIPTTIFTPSDVRAITHFLTSSYFLHYSLYLYVFSTPQEVHEEHQFIFVENAVISPPLSKAYTEQDWANLQVQEHQHRIASELAFLKNQTVKHEELGDAKLAEPASILDDKEFLGAGAGTGGVADYKSHLLHSAHPILTAHHPHHPSLFGSHLLPTQSIPYHPHHSISAQVSQSETQKIISSVNQAANAQIVVLREALQKQFEEQERQILEIIARVDTELSVATESTKPLTSSSPSQPSSSNPSNTSNPNSNSNSHSNSNANTSNSNSNSNSNPNSSSNSSSTSTEIKPNTTNVSQSGGGERKRTPVKNQTLPSVVSKPSLNSKNLTSSGDSHTSHTDGST
eukprot:Phypoly_transcript_08264.p1 GENE.Phypoly_transcript_08264~~Phypoly_transcript_08264.p1  ORF type:complete len:490 (+),score=111.52 Phypoly_transcript_08264:221-1471(+)